MHSLLTKYLKKKEIHDPLELTSDERVTFDNWNNILGKEELSLADVKLFCASQLGVIENRWSDFNLTQDRKAELIPYYNTYKTLLKVIESPKQAREALEQHLIQLLNN